MLSGSEVKLQFVSGRTSVAVSPICFANRATCTPSTIAYQGDSRPADVSNGGTKRTNLLIRGLLMNWQLHKAAVRSGQLLLIAPPATDYTLDLF